MATGGAREEPAWGCRRAHIGEMAVSQQISRTYFRMTRMWSTDVEGPIGGRWCVLWEIERAVKAGGLDGDLDTTM